MSKIINVNPQTVFMLVGPSGTGKSYFSKAIKKRLNEQGLSCTHLSSDLERELYSGYLDKDHPWAKFKKLSSSSLYFSKNAFESLDFKLKQSIAWPINSFAVIYDSTGLDPDLLDSVRKTSIEAGYEFVVVIFEGKDKSYLNSLGPEQRRISLKHLKRLDHIKSYIRSKKFTYFTINGFQDYSVEVNLPYFRPRTYCHSLKTAIIGDLHSNGEAFNKALKESEGYTRVFLGDLIDPLELNEKSIQDTISILEWFNNCNWSDTFLLLGNHEFWTYRALKGFFSANDIKNSKEFFPSYDFLVENPQYQPLFFNIVENSTPYLIGNTWIASHSLCDISHFGKLNSKSWSAQISTRYPDESQIVDFVINKCSSYNGKSGPTYFFGHIAFKEPQVIGRCYGLDTGAKYNHMVSLALVENWEVTLKKIDLGKSTKELFNTIVLPNRDFSTVNVHTKRTTYKAVISEGNFASPTISPPAATELGLETAQSCLNYYRSKQIPKVIAQEKHMGSRSQVYLVKDGESFATSRSGRRIKVIDVNKQIKDLHNEYFSKLEEYHPQVIILDCELMPWSALGSNLIEKEYMPMAEGLDWHVKELQETNCPFDILEELTGPKGKLRLDTLFQDLSEDKEGFLSTLDAFCKYDQPYFSPFSLLKVVTKEGEICGSETHLGFHLKGPNDLEIDLSDPKADSLLEGLLSFMDSNNKEGLVVKPLDMSMLNPSRGSWDYAPSIKLRTPSYLRLVYGPGYLRNLPELIKKKTVSKKLGLSVVQHNISTQLLKIPFYNNGVDNKVRTELIQQFHSSELSGLTLDQRL